MVIYTYDIFSDDWSNNYGQAFGGQIEYAYNGGIDTGYSFNNDFQCSNYDNLMSMGGNIEKIEGDIIYANDNQNNNYELQLGACSRINGLNKNYPQIGDNINWRGVPNYDNKYYVHTATCY